MEAASLVQDSSLISGREGGWEGEISLFNLLGTLSKDDDDGFENVA